MKEQPREARTDTGVRFSVLTTRERLNKALQLTISKVVRLCLCLGSTHVGTLLMNRKGIKINNIILNNSSYQLLL